MRCAPDAAKEAKPRSSQEEEEVSIDVPANDTKQDSGQDGTSGYAYWPLPRERLCTVPKRQGDQTPPPVVRF